MKLKFWAARKPSIEKNTIENGSESKHDNKKPGTIDTEIPIGFNIIDFSSTAHPLINLTQDVRPRIQIPMIPNFFTNLSVRLHPFRRALIAGLLFVISAIFAFVFLLVAPGRVALPTLMLFAVPLLVILWASICCASWFHPEHGRLSINRFSGRKQPAAVQSFARWYAATFLVIFVLAGVLGPLVLFR